MTSWMVGPDDRLFNACIDGNVKELKAALPTASLTAHHKSGLAAVHLVIKHGWTELLDVLLQAEVDLDLRIADSSSAGGPSGSWVGYTATHLAAILSGRSDCLSLLLERGAAQLYSRAPNGWTPLHCAAFAGRYESLRLLLEHDADPNPQAHDGRTPLMMAASMTMTRAVRLLLAAQANPHITDNDGSGGLHYALDTRSQSVLAGKMPLKPANYECAYLLVLSGCRTDVPSRAGVSPLDFLPPQWRLFYQLCFRNRACLLRGGTLPFADESGAAASEVLSGVGFEELLQAESTTLHSLGLARGDVSELRQVISVCWAEVARLRTGDASPARVQRRRHGVRPAPAPSATTGARGLVARVRANGRVLAAAAAALFFFWLGALAERYNDNALLYLMTLFLYDPFDGPAGDENIADAADGLI